MTFSAIIAELLAAGRRSMGQVRDSSGRSVWPDRIHVGINIFTTARCLRHGTRRDNFPISRSR